MKIPMKVYYDNWVDILLGRPQAKIDWDKWLHEYHVYSLQHKQSEGNQSPNDDG